MKTAITILFALMCLAQWVVPAKMIYDSEHVISNGNIFKFKTQPIDPSDPFRGKYITLNFESNFIKLKDTVKWQAGQEIFVTFTTDSAGFAIAEDLFSTPPDTESFLRTTVDYINDYQGEPKLWFTLPFDRFYLEESKASQAEQLYWQAQRDSTQVAYGLVSIGKGSAVLTDVILNDKPIVEIINSLNNDAD
jgi:uncharacterized membrane-anchored protein